MAVFTAASKDLVFPSCVRSSLYRMLFRDPVSASDPTVCFQSSFSLLQIVVVYLSFRHPQSPQLCWFYCPNSDFLAPQHTVLLWRCFYPSLVGLSRSPETSQSLQLSGAGNWIPAVFLAAEISGCTPAFNS